MRIETEPLLSIRNLRTIFDLDEGSVKAVDGVSFDVFPQRVLGIVGESGCGKSVTIKSILRLIEPPGKISEGEIWFHLENQKEGRSNRLDLAQLDSKGKKMRSIRGNEIALIPQEPMAAFSPVHTIGNQLIESVQLHQSLSKDQAFNIAVERLNEVGIPNPLEAMNRYSWELSGGLRQRAMIGMALTCNPSLLIADEPTTAIDVTTQAQVLNLIRDLQQKNQMAIIFITHDLGVIAQLADDVIVMYLGQVMEKGPVDEIFHNPLHPYSKALLKSIPGVKTKNRSKLPTIEGSIPHPFNRPKGCPFYQRCDDAIPGTCNQVPPNLFPVTEKQHVSCFKYHEKTDAL